MAKEKGQPQLTVITKEDGICEIHVEGSLLPNAVYEEILSVIGQLGVHTRKRFVVKNPVMIRLIRECIPKEYHEGIILEVKYDGEEIRRRAC